MASRLTVLMAVAFLAAPALSAEPGEPAQFNVGRAQEKITPPLGVSLAGYFHGRKAESVRDDLYARVLVIESGGERIALVSCDLICMTDEVVGAARGLISAETGIAGDHVMVCATHTHTGPELRSDGVAPRNEEWVGRLPRKIADCVVRACASMTPATLRAGSIDVTGYSFNRLWRQKDGSELFGRRKGELGPAGPIDPQLQTLSAVGLDGKLLAVVVNFALHVDVIGGGSANFVSADWPGVMADTLSRVYGSDVVTMLVQGMCGDINHVPHDPTALPRGGPAKSEQIGHALAGAAMAAMERAEPMGNGRLKAVEKTLEIPYYTRDAAFMAELAALKSKPDPTDFDKYFIDRGEKWPYDNQMAQAPVMRIGEISLVALPAEIFVPIGLEIKRWAPTPAFVVELANGRVTGYVPTTDQAERGAYGAKPVLSRWLCPDAGRRMADAALVMLHELDAPQQN